MGIHAGAHPFDALKALVVARENAILLFFRSGRRSVRGVHGRLRMDVVVSDTKRARRRARTLLTALTQSPSPEGRRAWAAEGLGSWARRPDEARDLGARGPARSLLSLPRGEHATGKLSAL